MINSSPIPSLPPELVQQWRNSWHFCHGEFVDYVAAQAAQWGADQELEACCEWLEERNSFTLAEAIRCDRRLKPPTLKEQALATLEVEPEDDKELIVFDTDQVDIIRRAIEALPND